MVIYFLLFTLVSLTLVSLILFDNDIISPAFLTCAGFTMSSMFCLYGLTTHWGGDIRWETYGVITVSLVVYVLCSWMVYIPKGNNRLERTSQPSNDMNIIILPISYIIVFCVIAAVVAYVYYVELIRIVSRLGGGGVWNEILAMYRNAAAADYIETVISTPIRWAMALVIYFGYFLIYILINNYIASGRINWFLFVVVLAVLLLSTMTANRVALVRYVLTAVILIYLTLRRKNGWNTRIKAKHIIYTTIIIFLIGMLFTFARGFVGRISTTEPLHYLAKYAGGPILLLDMVLDNPPQQNNGIFGEETFRGIYVFIGRYFADSQIIDSYNEFREWNGISMGNAYGVLRYYILDFGYVGAMIFIGLTSMISTYIYKKCRFAIIYGKLTKYKHNFILLFYAYFSYTLVFQFYGHGLSLLLVPGELRNVVFMYVTFRLFLRMQNKRETLNIKENNELRQSVDIS